MVLQQMCKLLLKYAMRMERCFWWTKLMGLIWALARCCRLLLCRVVPMPVPKVPIKS